MSIFSSIKDYNQQPSGNNSLCVAANDTLRNTEWEDGGICIQSVSLSGNEST